MAAIEKRIDPTQEPMYVSPAERKGIRAAVSVRAGMAFAAPTLMLGATLGMGLGFSTALLAALLGYSFVVLYMCFVSAQAADLGLPTASMAAPALGRKGARYLVSILVGVITIGWFGVQTAVCASSLSIMLLEVFGIHFPTWAASVILGGLMLGTAAVGFDGLKVLGAVAAPCLIIVCLYGVFTSISGEGSLSMITDYAPVADEMLGFVAGTGMAVGMFAFGGATTADLARFCRNRRDAVVSSILGVIPTSMIAIGTGAALALVTGESDIAVLMNSIGLPVIGLITLVLAAWSVNAGNVFSAGVNFNVLLGKSEGGNSRTTTIIAGIAGTLLAMAGILDAFTTFLSMLSACGPALAGVLIADYWIVRKGGRKELGAVSGVSIPGIVAFLAALLLGMITGGSFASIAPLAFLDIPFFIGPVNSIVAAIVLYVVLYKVR